MQVEIVDQATGKAVEQVEVWYLGLDHENSQGESDLTGLALSVHRALFRLTGDYEMATEVVESEKGLIARYVSPETAVVICKWINAAGGRTVFEPMVFEDVS